MSRSLLAASLLALAAAAQTTGARAAPPTFVMVSHSPESDSYWTSVVKGLQQAGKDLGVTVVYRGTDNNLNDPNQQRRNLEAAIASKPDGLIVTDPTPASLNDTIRKATSSGIPVVLINQGGDQVRKVGALAFVGDDPADQGALGAEQFNAMDAKHALVITTPLGAIPFVDARTNGFRKTFKGATSLAEIPVSDLNSSNRIKTITETQMQKDPSIDAVFSIGSCCIAAMDQVRADLGDRGKAIHWGTIDVTAGAMQAIKAHNLDFALDAQQYAQGYYPAVMLSLYLRQAIRPAAPILVTGPAVVTPDNVAKVQDSAGSR